MWLTWEQADGKPDGGWLLWSERPEFSAATQAWEFGTLGGWWRKLPPWPSLVPPPHPTLWRVDLATVEKVKEVKP